MPEYDHLTTRLVSLLCSDHLPQPTWWDPELREQRIAIAVQDVTGMTPEYWAMLDKPSRLPWLEKTIAALMKRGATPAETSEENPDAYRLVGERDPMREQYRAKFSEPHDPTLAEVEAYYFPARVERGEVLPGRERKGRVPEPTVEQLALAKLGFPFDHWLPPSLAVDWKSKSFPREPTQAAVQEWRSLLEAATAAGVIGFQGSGRGIAGDLENDLELLCRYDSTLVSTHKPGDRPADRNAADAAEGQIGDDFHVVLLIHGIRTQAEWQAMVRDAIAVEGRVEVIPIKYGYFDAIRFWFPLWTRSRPIARVEAQIRAALQKYRRDYPKAKLSIIAHSFGTYVIGRIMQKNFDLQLHRLVLCGSVLPLDFPWEQLQGRFDDEKVVNECGKSDIWPVLAQAASWGYGASGSHGFGTVLVKDRFHAGGHGQYFDRRFVEEYWEPFLRRGEYKPTAFEVQALPSPWWLSVVGILPLRWVILALLLGLVALLCFWLGRHLADGPADHGLRVYCLENVNSEYTYSLHTRKNGLTNYQDIRPILQQMGIAPEHVDMFPVSPGFTDYDTIKRKNPDIILLHASAFDVPKQGEASERMLELLRVMAEQPDHKTNFIIYGRTLPKEQRELDELLDQMIGRTSERLRGRLHAVRIAIDQFPDNPFQDPENIRRIQRAVKPHLKARTGGQS